MLGTILTYGYIWHSLTVFVLLRRRLLNNIRSHVEVLLEYRAAQLLEASLGSFGDQSHWCQSINILHLPHARRSNNLFTYPMNEIDWLNKRTGLEEEHTRNIEMNGREQLGGALLVAHGSELFLNRSFDVIFALSVSI